MSVLSSSLLMYSSRILVSMLAGSRELVISWPVEKGGCGTQRRDGEHLGISNGNLSAAPHACHSLSKVSAQAPWRSLHIRRCFSQCIIERKKKNSDPKSKNVLRRVYRWFSLWLVTHIDWNPSWWWLWGNSFPMKKDHSHKDNRVQRFAMFTSKDELNLNFFLLCTAWFDCII